WPKELLPEPGNLELEGEGNIDFYYWYYGSYALYQLSEEYPKAWRDWEKALEGAILPGQRDGNSPPCFEGSWGLDGALPGGLLPLRQGARLALITHSRRTRTRRGPGRVRSSGASCFGGRRRDTSKNRPEPSHAPLRSSVHAAHGRNDTADHSHARH
ncbi:MAG: hypothetical protein ACYTFV_11080, partial [Planctomycetota bacterium]